MDLNLREVAVGALGIGAAAGIFSRAAVAPTSQIFGRVLHRLEGESQGSVALTFDDGPNPSVTPEILALLERHNARATFFVMGRYARGCPALIREIAARGHLLGNHTETHPNLVWKSRAQIAAELGACNEAVLEALRGADSGRHMRWLRPPFGFRGPQLARAAREFAPAGIATWCRMAYDWKPQPAEPMIARLARVRGRDIVLLHDGDHRCQNGDRAHVVAALEHWLPRWRDAGFEFVTIPNGAAAS